MTLTVRSDAFSHGERIPTQYTGDGADRSPPLAWDNVPDGAQELALICDDPDAPTSEPWVHWLLYKIPAHVRQLPAGLPPQARLHAPTGALQGKNSWTSGRTVGYRGPAPPPGHGVHRYFFHLYALDTPLDVEPELDKPSLLAAMKGHVLADGVLLGTYERK